MARSSAATGQQGRGRRGRGAWKSAPAPSERMPQIDEICASMPFRKGCARNQAIPAWKAWYQGCASAASKVQRMQASPGHCILSTTGASNRLRRAKRLSLFWNNEFEGKRTQDEGLVVPSSRCVHYWYVGAGRRWLTLLIGRVAVKQFS